MSLTMAMVDGLCLKDFSPYPTQYCQNSCFSCSDLETPWLRVEALIVGMPQSQLPKENVPETTYRQFLKANAYFQLRLIILLLEPELCSVAFLKGQFLITSC